MVRNNGAAPGATLQSLLETVAERGSLSDVEIQQAVSRLGPGQLDDAFWERLGGPMTDLLEDVLMAALLHDAEAGWQVWDGHPAKPG
jgi:hypothetical protein